MERLRETVADQTRSVEFGNPRDEVRARVLAATIELLSNGGRDAVTTRAVAEAAGVQAPTLYRLFGDKDGLLDAVAEHGFARYLRSKAISPLGDDPVADLRSGWNLHVEFGLSNPALYLLMYAAPRPGTKSPAAQTSYSMLQSHIRRVALVGRLRMGEERAANFFHASACGIVLTLLAMLPEARDMRLSELARDAALSAIVTDSPATESSGHAAAAVALRASLSQATPLSKGERTLLDEWLNRLAQG